MVKRPLSSYVLDDRFLSLMAFILIFAMAARTPLDSDMWWHLRAGEESVRQGRPLTVDVFSSTRYGERWINHSWLSEMGMYGLFHSGGYFALGFAVATIATLSMAFVYLQMEGHVLLKAFILVFASIVASLVWSPRPQLISLLFFGMLGYLLYLFKWKKRDYLWSLPVIFLFWSNLHGGYVLGLLLIGALIAGEIFDRIQGKLGPEAISLRDILRIGLWAGASILVVVINPNGLAMWGIPFRTVGVGVLREFISEWASPDFHEITQQPMLWLLMLTIITLALSKLPVNGYELFSFCGFAYLAFVARRNYGPFAMVTAPILARHLNRVLTDWWVNAKPAISPYFTGKLFEKLNAGGRSEPPLHWRVLINSAVLLLFSSAAIAKLAIVTSPNLVSTYAKTFYPAEAVEWIERNRPPREIFNEYNWGGYLIWNLRQYPVFVDGRTDLYHDTFLRSYLEVMSGDGEWESILQDYSINLILLGNKSQLGQELLEHPGWTRVYHDSFADVFERQNAIQGSLKTDRP